MDQKSGTSSRIAVVGFPYVRDEYFEVFRHWPDSGAIRFLLPNEWSAKGGKVRYEAPNDERVTKASAFFSRYHQETPVIGGLLKGFMPSFPVFLWKNRKKIDLVYACSEPILLVTLYYALWTKLFRKKLVLFSWENLPYDQKFRGISHFVHVLLLRMNLWLADGLMCGNSEGVDVHRQYTDIPIRIIPMNGVDPDRFRPHAAEGHYPELERKLVYTFAGAIGYRKGIHLVVEALPAVLEHVPQAHLVIAGSGEYEKQIEDRIEALGLSEHVTRFPWVSHHELVRLMSVSDVFVYPSISHGGWAEQFGYSMAEASLMELPVIGTRTGSMADVVKNGETGLLVAPDNVRELTDAMVTLGNDRQLRERLGKAGRAYMTDQFSHEAVAEKMHEFFISVAEM